ncbi:MAG: hypothetical protein ACRD3A_14005 [Terriglobales bacterium]
MNLFNEFALLFAVATPLVVLFAMNLFLMMEGERGTLMLPIWNPEAVADAATRVRPAANQPHYQRAA